ncbi:MAG: BON domain-containing protein [Ferruginibacter sp.]
MKIARLIFAVSFTALVGFAGCSSKETDIDIKINIETKLKAAPDMAGVIVAVKNGIVTVEGQCKDEACKINCEKIAQAVKGVKTVINDLTVTDAPPVTAPAVAASPVMVIPEDPLINSVAKVAKNFPSVKAEVKDSIVTLTGEIKKTELPKLMNALSSLKPKKIEQKLTVVKNLRKKSHRSVSSSKSKKRTLRRRH